jgi:hypothetical protein
LVLIVPCLGADFTLPWCSLGLVLVLISLCFGADLVFYLDVEFIPPRCWSRPALALISPCLDVDLTLS